MNILFYGPFNYRSRDNESVILKLKEQNHNVMLLTSSEGNSIIDFLQRYGIRCDKTGIKHDGWRSILMQVHFLVKFIKSKKIQVVFSHLETSNFVAVLAQYFVQARIVIVRHHSDLFYLNKLHTQFSYKYTYRNAKHIIAVSNHAKKFMVEKEGVNASKISVINLSYNFSHFDAPNLNNVRNIRDSCNTDLVLLTAGRLVKNKRTELSIDVVDALIKAGHSVKLLVVGEGELNGEIVEQVNSRGLQDACRLEGFRKNIMDFLMACDILLHPSESESSSVIIKEAGVQRKVIIACKGVGDCDEYIVNGENGFLVDKDDFVNQAVDIIANRLTNAAERKRIGGNLFTAIRERFDVEKNIKEYQKFLE